MLLFLLLVAIIAIALIIICCVVGFAGIFTLPIISEIIVFALIIAWIIRKLFFSKTK